MTVLTNSLKKTNSVDLCMLGAGYVEYIHDELLIVFWPSSEQGATAGIRDRTLIESAVARPFYSAFGDDMYPTVVKKGIALFHSPVSNHAFVDGNKRTAVTAFDHFLLANDWVLGVPNSIMYEIARNTACYRERNVSHDAALEEIESLTSSLIAPITRLEAELAGIDALEGSFESTMAMRNWIRKHPLNRLV